jgi:hypothetical protein
MIGFVAGFESALPEGMSLAEPVRALMTWLEDGGQAFTSTSTGKRFLNVHPVAHIDGVWSHLSFQTDPEFMTYWAGNDALNARVAVLARCGGDGSVLAQWQSAGGPQYVFLGSEGDAFLLTDDPVAFVQIVTMGYYSIEERATLEATPERNWTDFNGPDPWPEPRAVKEWVEAEFAVRYPACGAALMAGAAENGFGAWLDRQTG